MPEPDIDQRPGPSDRSPVETIDLGRVGAGLDALDTPAERRPPAWRRALSGVLPPLVAIGLLLAIWQGLWALALWPEFRLPAPAAVGTEIWGMVRTGEIFPVLWTSLHRAILGFLIAVAVATPLGLLVARVRVVRAAVGPVITGLQSLPSVAWVPAAVLWFGLTPTTIFAVVLLGSVPSVINGLVAGVDQVPPILTRAGQAMGAGRISGARHILLPAALPGYLAGCKQGWAFSWRSLMAAELIAASPQLGIGLGQTLEQARSFNDMPGVLAAILLILLVGVSVDLLVFRPLERRILLARGLSGVV
ncbi:MULTISPECIES: ABC transporter permease [Actinoalloteichus]|uniref:ABC-type nitrate/sulfonate/bicarbonate transport system, permease component n=1 Tax=Actinoalloteichus fjordicus TaxID=1612552 RepID=A0AAC9PUF6_9PSEU|nr:MULTISPECIES: ABC transporter permease [Actinoalloteichus]APU16926.1 ABC-type nitrate/sulfonate/bicarbonate transport system, permease component [Actinoalloteichus fjordicus]APU23006.1 ABC-type nitrate/sulfonate/bicarbonate transport system, permease component [Actinoalloteichus sp. GBA129-24]